MGVQKAMKNWDRYFLRIAREVSTNSKCLSRQIGAVLVRDKAIISTGYNGAPRGVKHCEDRSISFYNEIDCGGNIVIDLGHDIIQCPRRLFGYKSGQGLHLCQAGHAERNAIVQAARNGISTKDTSLYCYCTQVCKDCAIEIINAGVTELIFLNGPPYDKYAGTILEEGGIIIRRLDGKELDEPIQTSN